MKITLRKMLSCEIGGRYLSEFFSPVPLDSEKAVISVTFNFLSSRYYSLLSRYISSPTLVQYWRLILTDYYTERIAHRVRALRQVVRVTIEDKDFILVPPTYSSNNPSITRYARSVLDELTEFVHFTHFGYLETKFPSSQINKILKVFLSDKERDCEICWDIDEKFLPQMQELLKEEYARHDIHSPIDTFDSTTFRWNEELIQSRRARDNMLRAVRSARNQIARQDAEETNEPGDMNFRNHEVGPSSTGTAEETNGPGDMTFRNHEIGSSATGTAGEYYALCFLIRGGLVACKAPEGTATYDLLAMQSNATSFVPVQVKTITNSSHWLLSARHETVVPNLVFCFIRFGNSMTDSRIFFVPADVVSHVISMAHQIYLSLPDTRGRQRRNNSIRTVELDYSVLLRRTVNPNQYLNQQQLEFISEHSIGWLDRYENNLDLFNPQK